MTVSITIPQRPHASAAVMAKLKSIYGKPSQNARTRSVWNTSPSSSIRAWGQALNRTAKAYQQSTGRVPDYISGSTEYAEFVLTDANNDVYVDDQFNCTSGAGNCTATFNVPLGSGYVGDLYLYDYCGYLVSAGSAAVPTITATNSPSITVTLNGVVEYYDVEPNPNPSASPGLSEPFIGDASQSQTFPVSVFPYDVDENTITTPGTLVDYTLTPITGINLAVDGSDTTPTGTSTLSVNPDLTITSQTYTFKGKGSETSVNWSATPVTSGTPVASSNFAGYGGSTNNPRINNLSIAVDPVQLMWTNPEGFPVPPGYGNAQYNTPLPIPSGQNYQLFQPDFAQVAQGTWALEFPQMNDGQGSGYLGLLEAVAPPSSAPYPLTSFTGNLNFTDNGYCAGVFNYPSPSPISYASPDPTYGLIITGSAYNLSSPSPGAGGTPCTVIVTDTSAQARQASLQVYYDSSSLTIQSHARRTK
jgi:hypothetical protein